MRYALRIIPYVFLRSKELRMARWEDIDLKKAQWIIPAEHMKMKRPHVVPLAKQVVKLLTELKEFTGDRELVFPSSHSKTRCISDMGLLNALRLLGYSKDQVCIHGFRSTASTLLNEKGYRSEVIEAQLAHAERNEVRAAYNRAQYLTERTKMMQDYADYLDDLRAGTKPVTANIIEVERVAEPEAHIVAKAAGVPPTRRRRVRASTKFLKQPRKSPPCTPRRQWRIPMAMSPPLQSALVSRRSSKVGRKPSRPCFRMGSRNISQEAMQSARLAVVKER